MTTLLACKHFLAAASAFIFIGGMIGYGGYLWLRSALSMAFLASDRCAEARDETRSRQ